MEKEVENDVMKGRCGCEILRFDSHNRRRISPAAAAVQLCMPTMHVCSACDLVETGDAFVSQ